MIKYLLLLASLLPLSAFALNLTGYHFSDSSRYAIVDDTMVEKYPGKFVFSGSAAYVNSPFFEADILNNRVTKRIINFNDVFTFGGTYYLSDQSAVSVRSAYVMNEVNNVAYSSFSDSEIKGRFNIYKEGAHSVSLNPVLSLPTGKKDNYTTAGSIGAGIAVAGEMKIEQFMLQGSLGYLNAGDNKIKDIDYSQLMTSSIAISWDFKPEWTVNVESYRNFTIAADEGQDEGSYYFVLKNSSFKGVNYFAGLGIAGIYAPYSDNYTMFFGLKMFESK